MTVFETLVGSEGSAIFENTRTSHLLESQVLLAKIGAKASHLCANLLHMYLQVFKYIHAIYIVIAAFLYDDDTP
ncbi:Uncharacterised protein [BD1-7 clade bacterium]|uniref:Uncharacterized protein n=1 Tax=BD1-7 clade bacterium TaxID=2029982 RepID=A0A5S9P9R8_9GAMM|nr:Uncharacterised protein [BD1-7 clade bacterium]CAA0101324.1 Uncharacterised protein [BD1-7 clade bacterium]